MQVIKTSQKSSLFRRILAGQLMLALAWPSAAQITPVPTSSSTTGDVSVKGDSAALQNLGRAVQSPDARSSNLPARSTPQNQSNFILPDMGDPGGDSLSRMDEKKYGEMIMRQIRPDPDYSNDLPIYDFLNQMERRLLEAAKRLQLVPSLSN